MVTKAGMQASCLPVLVQSPSPPLSWKNCMQGCTITQNKYRKGGGRAGWGGEQSSGLHQWTAFHKNCYRVKSLQWFQFHLLAANQETETASWPLRLQMNINSLTTRIAYIPFRAWLSFFFFLSFFGGRGVGGEVGGMHWDRRQRTLSSRWQFKTMYFKQIFEGRNDDYLSPWNQLFIL